jgi:putative membrane protein
MPSEPNAVGIDDVERRLHPLSWLFAALQQLRAFALPLIVLLLTGRGNRYELFGAVGAVGIAISGLVQYLTYRYRLGPDGIAITSGFFQRTRRDIPYDRIHNVVLHQSVLHRLFGVVELRLESAGGQKAEGHMRVLGLAEAQALEDIIRSRGVGARTTAETATSEAVASATLLRLPNAEVVKLGLISNRGMVLVAAALGTMWQVLPDGSDPDDLARAVFGLILDEALALPAWATGPAGIATAVVVLLVGAVLAVRLLSVVLAVLQFYGFTLFEEGRQLRVERGLLTRVRLSLPRGRIQAWRVSETLLHRWFGRRSLRVDTAGGVDAGSMRGMRDLVPLATPDVVDGLMVHVLAGAAWPPAEWRPLHARTWRRLIVWPGVIVLSLTALAVWQFGAWGGLVMLAMPIVWARARLWARHAAYAEVPGGLVAMREGWLSKSWHVAEIAKLQALSLTESPFDRRHGMASLWLDTAGATGGVLRIPFLPIDEARALHDRLARVMES